MSKFDKLLARFKTFPKDFSYDELRTLLRGLGYSESHQGKTSGSRVAFIHEVSRKILRLHKPHPGNILKRYQLEQLLESLMEGGEIK